MRPVRVAGVVFSLVALGTACYVLAQRPEAATAASPSTSATPPKPKSITPSNQGVAPGAMYHRVYVVSPLVGSGKAGDPIRPVFAPTPPGAGGSSATAPTAPAAAHSGLLGYQMQLSDDGKTALVEMVFSDPIAFQAVMKQEASNRGVSVSPTANASPAAVSTSLSSALQTAVPGLQIFERGKATDAQILAAFQKYKANFSFSGATVRPQ